MTASFPSAIKSFTTKENYVTPIEADHINDLQFEVVAIETELGINSTNVPAKLLGTGNAGAILGLQTFTH
jgi:hypothetical protein